MQMQGVYLCRYRCVQLCRYRCVQLCRYRGVWVCRYRGVWVCSLSIVLISLIVCSQSYLFFHDEHVISRCWKIKFLDINIVTVYPFVASS